MISPDLFIAYAIGCVVGVIAAAIVIFMWPSVDEDHSGPPPDPDEDMLKQLKRCRHVLERLLNNPETVQKVLIVRTINQAKKTINDAGHTTDRPGNPREHTGANTSQADRGR